MTTFIRPVDQPPDEKDKALRGLIATIASTGAQHLRSAGVYERSPRLFSDIPGSPFSYWAPSRCFRRCVEAVGGGAVTIVSTNPLNADFRYVRVWWEPSARSTGRLWHPWAKGGTYSPYYYDINTVISWNMSRSSYHGFLGTSNRPLERPASVQYFFRPGPTWPRRTQSGLGVRAMPAGCIFADKGPGVFLDENKPSDLLALLTVMTSSPYRSLVDLQIAFRSY